MADPASYSAPRAGLSCDLLIVGGGIVGLWCARFAAQLGLDIILCDSRAIGAGASGGFLGALMPHMPDRWNAKKQFQFEALVELEVLVAALEEETGMSTGYRRAGRILPLAEPRHRVLAVERSREAAMRWRTANRSFDWQVVDAVPAPGWPDEAAREAGAVFETLAARIDPRALVAALKATLEASAGVRLVEGNGVVSIDDSGALLADGTRVAAGQVIVAAGHDSFPMLDRLMPEPAANLGRAVKGQAVLLRADIPAELPLVFRDGVYIVPHEDGRVAVGSTSEDSFGDPFATDHRLDAVLVQAVALCPLLDDAIVLERWAGLRPRAIGRDPMIGRMPHMPSVIVATGGFKITLAIAHKMAQNALAIIGGADPGLPESFELARHLEQARSTVVGRS